MLKIQDVQQVLSAKAVQVTLDNIHKVLDWVAANGGYYGIKFDNGEFKWGSVFHSVNGEEMDFEIGDWILLHPDGIFEIADSYQKEARWEEIG